MTTAAYAAGNGGFHDGFKFYQTAIPAARTDVRLYKLRELSFVVTGSFAYTAVPAA